MSTNVKMVGYYKKFDTLEEMIEKLENLLSVELIKGGSREDFIEANWDELFDNDFNSEQKVWLPYLDVEGNMGVVYITDYEYDAFDVVAIFNEETPLFFGEKGIPFCVIYYNGGDCPLILK